MAELTRDDLLAELVRTMSDAHQLRLRVSELRGALEALVNVGSRPPSLEAHTQLVFAVAHGRTVLAKPEPDAGGLECGWCHELMPAHAPGCEGADHG